MLLSGAADHLAGRDILMPMPNIGEMLINLALVKADRR